MSVRTEKLGIIVTDSQLGQPIYPLGPFCADLSSVSPPAWGCDEQRQFGTTEGECWSLPWKKFIRVLHIGRL